MAPYATTDGVGANSGTSPAGSPIPLSVVADALIAFITSPSFPSQQGVLAGMSPTELIKRIQRQAGVPATGTLDYISLAMLISEYTSSQASAGGTPLNPSFTLTDPKMIAMAQAALGQPGVQRLTGVSYSGPIDGTNSAAFKSALASFRQWIDSSSGINLVPVTTADLDSTTWAFIVLAGQSYH